jgi:hypothetical protein
LVTLNSWFAIALIASACGGQASSTPHSATPSGTTTTLTWSHPSLTAGPSSRDDADVASYGGGVLVFGGEDHPYSGNYLGDTWIYSSGAWKQLKFTAHPPALIQGGIAYDPADQATLLYGGGDSGGTCTSATWTFSGDKWHLLKTASAPPARYVGGMAYSPANKGVLMFGGEACNAVAPSPVNDTWLWTLSGWQQFHPTHSPPLVGLDGMASDPATDQVVLLTAMSPVAFSKTHAGETWVWNGTTWTRSTSAPTPADRWGSAMAYDPALHEIVLFGGSDLEGTSRANSNDAWAWTGSSWKRLAKVNPPPDEVFASMTADTTTSRLVLLEQDAAPATSTWTAGS